MKTLYLVSSLKFFHLLPPLLSSNVPKTKYILLHYLIVNTLSYYIVSVLSFQKRFWNPGGESCISFGLPRIKKVNLRWAVGVLQLLLSLLLRKILAMRPRLTSKSWSSCLSLSVLELVACATIPSNHCFCDGPSQCSQIWGKYVCLCMYNSSLEDTPLFFFQKKNCDMVRRYKKWWVSVSCFRIRKCKLKMM